MDGLMMDFQLTLPHLLRRAETYFGNGEIVTRLPDKSFHRTTYRDTMRRSRQLAVALQKLGLERGDRVATLCWNHHQHHEAYFGIPCGGFVLHTLNLRLHPNDLAYIAKHAGDRAVIVDRALLPLLEQFKDRTQIEHVFVVEDSYEELLASARRRRVGRSRARRERGGGDVLHERHDRAAEGRRLLAPLDGAARARRRGEQPARARHLASNDAILPVVPMFHANAWGYPYLATMVGAKLVYPGPHLDPREPARRDFAQEKVSVGGGRADDLDGHPAAARREPGQRGISRAIKGDARRRLRGAARDDRRVRAAPRHPDRAGLGHDRDVAGRVDGARCRTTSRDVDEETRFDLMALRRACRSRSSRSARASATRRSRGTARRWASSRCAARGSRRATTTRPSRPTAGRTTAGSRPATSSRSTRAATSRSRTARRT